jgi:hypothetical protein
MTDTGRPPCANPACARPLMQRATGRPGRYCSASCRQAAYRDRLRQADRAARDAQRLVDARADMARLWPQLETASLDAAETAAAVLSYVAIEDEADLEWKLRELRREIDRLERLALAYRRAAELAETADLRSAMAGPGRGRGGELAEPGDLDHRAAVGRPGLPPRPRVVG